VITISKESNINFLSYIIIIDLVFGGAGRYFEVFGISARIMIFAISLSLCLIKILVKRCFINTKLYLPFLLFFFSIILSTIIGLISNNISYVFSGLSGYLYLLYIIFFIQNIETKEKAVKIFRILNLMVVVLSIIHIIMFILLYLTGGSFYSVMNPILINKDFGFLDIGYNGIGRVFLKTGVFIPISCIYYLIDILQSKRFKLKSVLYFTILLVGLVTTMTMGFWIAFIVGVLITSLFFMKKTKSLYLIIIFIATLLIVFTKIGVNPIDIITNRLDSNDPSRMFKEAQISVLWDTFKQHVFLGNGFGKEVILSYAGIYRSGTNWENMWLYLLVTNGLVGLFAYLNLILSIMKIAMYKLSAKSNEERITLLTITIGLIMECIISLSNPFLSNPIGIGFICLSAGIVNRFIKKTEKI